MGIKIPDSLPVSVTPEVPIAPVPKVGCDNKQLKKRNIYLYSALVISFSLAFIFICIQSCNRDKKDFQKIENTIYSFQYKDFIRKYPQSVYVERAYDGLLHIAKKEGISKATVSRILKSAMDKGIIEVRIKDSILNDTALEKDLIDAYPIKRAVIVPDLVENEQILLQDVCAALIDDLPRYVKNDSVIGVFYGHTLTALTRQLPKIKRKGVSVIQLAGGFSRAVYESNSLSILRSFADCFGGTAYQIPAPAMVEKPFIVEALKQDSQIAKVCDMAEICETAIFSVGNLERPSILYEMGLITSIEYQDMIHRGAIGDCCSHFLNKNGDVFDETMDARVVGPSLEAIKKIPNKMLVVSGKKKAAVIHAALKGGLADSLYIDAPTAEELLKKQF